jgi:hypothetical protein
MGIFASIKNWLEEKKRVKEVEKLNQNYQYLKFQKDYHFESSSQKDGGQITRPRFR